MLFKLFKIINRKFFVLIQVKKSCNVKIIELRSFVSLIRNKMNDLGEYNPNIRLITARDVNQARLDYPTLTQCCFIVM